MCVSCICTEYTVAVQISSGICRVWIKFSYDGSQGGCLRDRGVTSCDNLHHPSLASLKAKRRQGISYPPTTHTLALSLCDVTVRNPSHIKRKGRI